MRDRHLADLAESLERVCDRVCATIAHVRCIFVFGWTVGHAGGVHVPSTLLRKGVYCIMRLLFSFLDESRTRRDRFRRSDFCYNFA